MNKELQKEMYKFVYETWSDLSANEHEAMLDGAMWMYDKLNGGQWCDADKELPSPATTVLFVVKGCDKVRLGFMIENVDTQYGYEFVSEKGEYISENDVERWMYIPNNK